MLFSASATWALAWPRACVSTSSTKYLVDGLSNAVAKSGEQRHDYDRPGSYTIRVTVRDTRWGTEDGFKEEVKVQ